MNNFIIVLVVSLVGAISTYVISNKYKQSPVLVSAYLGLIGGIVCLFIDKGFNLTISLIYPAVFYGATFVGMTSEKVINHWGFIILGTLVYSIIYSFASVTFKGFGGGLGTMASFSVLFAFAFQFILNSLMKKSPDANLHKK